MRVAIIFLSLCLPALADLLAGDRAYLSGDYATAFKEFLPLAKQGNAHAQLYVGAMYRAGQGIPQDYNEAMRLLRLAADQGQSFGQYTVGFLFSEGQGVPQSYEEAAKWYRLAAVQGFGGCAV